MWHVPKYWVDERDARGSIGTAVHALWSKMIDPQQPVADFSELSREQIEEIISLAQYLEKWLQDNDLGRIVAVEEPLVSRNYEYGGTPDVIANKIVDVKTGYVNEFACMLQLSAYNNLALENGLTDKHLDGIILQPYEGEVKEYRFSSSTLQKYFSTFLALLRTYNDEKTFIYSRKKKWK